MATDASEAAMITYPPKQVMILHCHGRMQEWDLNVILPCSGSTRRNRQGERQLERISGEVAKSVQIVI